MWETFYRALGEVAHWTAALPIAACGLLAFRALRGMGQGPDREAVLLAAAFAVSFLCDAISQQVGGPNAWVEYLAAPVQFALLLYVIAPAGYHRTIALAYALVVAVSVPFMHTGTPETVVQVIAGAWLCLIAWGHSSRYRLPVMLYAGAAVPPLLVMSWLPVPAMPTGPWMVAWSIYQFVRIAGLWWFMVLLLRPHARLLEVVNVGAGGVAARRRRGGGARALRADSARGAGGAVGDPAAARHAG